MIVNRIIAVALMSTLLGTSSVLAAVSNNDHFTLMCTGTRESANETVPSNFEFRVDLTARKWCDNACDDVRSFAKIERDQLTFSESDSGNLREFSYIDRRTGEYTQVVSSPLLNSRTKAQCTRGPAKPITYKKRKF